MDFMSKKVVRRSFVSILIKRAGLSFELSGSRIISARMYAVIMLAI